MSKVDVASKKASQVVKTWEAFANGSAAYVRSRQSLIFSFRKLRTREALQAT